MVCYSTTRRPFSLSLFIYILSFLHPVFSLSYMQERSWLFSLFCIWMNEWIKKENNNKDFSLFLAYFSLSCSERVVIYRIISQCSTEWNVFEDKKTVVFFFFFGERFILVWCFRRSRGGRRRRTEVPSFLHSYHTCFLSFPFPLFFTPTHLFSVFFLLHKDERRKKEEKTSSN